MAIDVSKIIHAVMEGSKIRESKGIIPLFGVYLSLFSVHYYNRLSFGFEQKMNRRRGAAAEILLIEAAQECGYATFQGIRNSWEWEQVVAPMIENKKDQILGFAAVAVAFGWGDLEVKEIIPNENYFEISYEDLVAEPLKQVQKIYDKLGLPDFNKAKSFFEEYLESKKDYKTNVYSIDKNIIDKVKDNWDFTIKMWKYKPPS